LQQRHHTKAAAAAAATAVRALAEDDGRPPATSQRRARCCWPRAAPRLGEAAVAQERGASRYKRLRAESPRGAQQLLARAALDCNAAD